MTAPGSSPDNPQVSGTCRVGYANLDEQSHRYPYAVGVTHPTPIDMEISP